MPDTKTQTAPLYIVLARTLEAMANCAKSGNTEWEERHAAHIATLCNEHLPSGSGFDNGTEFDDASTSERLVFTTAFHHMTEHGYYDGWTEHTVTVTPSLGSGFNLRIGGRNRNEIKDMIGEYFDEMLRRSVNEYGS